MHSVPLCAHAPGARRDAAHAMSRDATLRKGNSAWNQPKDATHFTLESLWAASLYRGIAAEVNQWVLGHAKSMGLFSCTSQWALFPVQINEPFKLHKSMGQLGMSNSMGLVSQRSQRALHPCQSQWAIGDVQVNGLIFSAQVNASFMLHKSMGPVS